MGFWEGLTKSNDNVVYKELWKPYRNAGAVELPSYEECVLDSPPDYSTTGLLAQAHCMHESADVATNSVQTRTQSTAKSQPFAEAFHIEVDFNAEGGFKTFANKKAKKAAKAAAQSKWADSDNEDKKDETPAGDGDEGAGGGEGGGAGGAGDGEDPSGGNNGGDDGDDWGFPSKKETSKEKKARLKREKEEAERKAAEEEAEAEAAAADADAGASAEAEPVDGECHHYSTESGWND